MSVEEGKNWYAVYTAPRAEKKVSERFTEAGIDHYLPLQVVQRKWSDRIKDVLVPVVSGYIFVNIFEHQAKDVLNVFGALSFVREFGSPVIIPSKQIEQLRLMVEFSEEEVIIYTENMKPGETIVVNRGPLQGLVGELVKVKGKHRVIIRLEHFGCAQTTIPLSYLQKA